MFKMRSLRSNSTFQRIFKEMGLFSMLASVNVWERDYSLSLSSPFSFQQRDLSMARSCRCKGLPYCTWRSPDIAKTFPLKPQVQTYRCTNDLPCANSCDNCAFEKECHGGSVSYPAKQTDVERGFIPRNRTLLPRHSFRGRYR